MTREEDNAVDAIDPSEPIPAVPPEVEAEEGTNEDGPEAQILYDEESGKTFIAFEIDPESIEPEEEGGEEK